MTIKISRHPMQSGIVAKILKMNAFMKYFSACASIRSDYHQGNIYKDDFVDVWENRFRPYRDRRWMKKDDCATCKWFRYCQGNGMHLRDSQGNLLLCNLKKL